MNHEKFVAGLKWTLTRWDELRGSSVTPYRERLSDFLGIDPATKEAEQLAGETFGTIHMLWAKMQEQELLRAVNGAMRSSAVQREILPEFGSDRKPCRRKSGAAA